MPEGLENTLAMRRPADEGGMGTLRIHMQSLPIHILTTAVLTGRVTSTTSIRRRHTRRKPGPQSYGSSLLRDAGLNSQLLTP
jgi:hypothetical protein